MNPKSKNPKPFCFHAALFLCAAFLAFAPAAQGAGATAALVISPFQTNVLQGQSTMVTATVNVTIAAYAGTAVTLAASGQPAADTATLSTTSFTANGTYPVTLTISNDSSVVAGNYPISITAGGGGGTANTEVFGLIVGNSVWTGGGADTNWSTSANWQTAPAAGSQVIFTDLGRSATAATVNNAVDSTTWLSSLQYANGANFLNTLIPSGVALNVTNTGGLMVGSVGTYGLSTTNTATLAGGGTLNVSNASAKIVLNQGDYSLNGCRAVLDLSGLSNFTANAYAIGIGSIGHFPSQISQRSSGSLYLAATNLVTLGLTNSLSTYLANPAVTNAIELSYNSAANNASTASFLFLGQTNAFFVDSLGVGRAKSTAGNSPGIIKFNPAFASPVAYFRGVGGNSSRVTWWGVGDEADYGSSAQYACGTNDFTGGTVDALVDTMCLGRDTSASQTKTGANNTGVLLFGSGKINVNTLYLGYNAFAPAGNSTPAVGILNLAGNGTVSVNTALNLGATNGTFSAAAVGTYGQIIVTNGGTLQAQTINVYSNNVNNLVRLVGGSTLLVTNALATNNFGLATFAMTNSTLGLSVTANAPLCGLVQTLNTGGTNNLIQLLSLPIFPSYPTQVALVKFTAWNGTNNFGLASIPAWAPGATLVSNGPNKSLDLSLPTDPRPIITSQPTPYSGNPGDNVTANLAVTIASGAVAPVGYKWYYTNGASTNLLANGPGPSGLSILSGATSANLQIANAQPGDNGAYFVVVANAYGTNTSSLAQLTISSSAIPPTVGGPSAQTATNGVTTTISDTEAGNPVPTFYWQFNGVTLTDGTGPSGSSTISGSTTTTLQIANPQYPGDQGTYSLIASNSAGLATNNTVLTVIVPPVITNQPVSLTVTNTQSASFTVVAGGVPAPTYQWSKNGTPISAGANPTATTATLSIASAAPSDMGNYACAVSNPAGVTNTVTVSLTVNSAALTVAGLSPANGQAGVCYDTPLYLNFSQTPTLRTAGKIRIYNVTNAAVPADTIDLGLSVTANALYAANIQPYTFSGDTITNFPVIIKGTQAAIYPHHGLLTSNQTYYVTVDNGTFVDSSNANFAGITATNVWKFTTKPTGPANATNLVVAADGTGDFLTVQGAVDSVALNNTTPTTINIRNGTYTEEVYVKSKNNLDFRGQSRNGTIIGYPNNNWVNGNGAPWRSMFIVNGNDCAFESLTITNTTPAGGSQAEAMDVEGTRAIFYNMELDSFQDTFLVHSAGKLVYFQDSLIQGQTDFNWGYGTVYYTNCEVRSLLTGGHVTQPRSPYTTNGFGFINCRITGTNSFDLGRTINTPTSPSEVLFCNCLMADTVTGYASDAGTNMADYNCSNLTATAYKTLSPSAHPSGSDPFVIAIQSAATWLYGWQPQLAPNITSQPANQSVSGGGTATFTVTATGISAPAYQWLKNGVPMPGQTGSTLTISGANANNVGTYSVIVSNLAGTVTSGSASLAVGNTAPTLTPVSDQTVNVGANVNIANVATDPDVPAQTLTFSLVAGAGSVDPSSGIYTWRPQVADAGTVNAVKVAVTDNGTPALSATNSFNVTVNVLTSPAAGSPSYDGSQFSVSVSGQVGPDYYLQANTNLSGGTWKTVATNTPTSSPFNLADPNAGSQPVQFYRIFAGPPAPPQ